MRAAKSLLHLVSGGFILSAGWLAAALLCFLLPVTRPMAGLCWRLAAFNLHPFGSELVQEREVRQFQYYLRTGRRSSAPPRRRLRGVSAVQAALWAPLGTVLVGAHVLHGLAVSILGFSNPWRSRSFSLLGPAVLPIGWHVAPISSGRVNFVRTARRPPRRRPSSARRPWPLKRIARSGTATAGGAVLVLWASYSATGPLIVPPGTGLGPDGGQPGVSAIVQNPMPSELYRYRPEANPPLPLGRTAQRAAEVIEPCRAAAVAPANQQLARRHLEFAMPLGAARMGRGAGGSQEVVLRRVEKMQTLAASRHFAKVPGAKCREDVEDNVIRSASFAARQAENARLARKAAPEFLLASLGRSATIGEARRRHPIEPRRIAAIGRMAALLSPAKAGGSISIAQAAERVGKTAALRSVPPI